MNRFRCRMVPVFALMLAGACSGDSFESFQGDLDRLVATPSQIFLDVGESKNVEVSGLDQQGNPLTFNFEVTQQGNGIDVRRDSTFLPIYVDDTTLAVPETGERFRFIVTGTGYASSSFTVSAGGQTLVVPVQVAPRSFLEATLSTAAPALGETVTITAPAGTSFSPTSVVTLPGDVQPFTVAVNPDGSSLDVVLPPNLTDAALTITDVTTAAAPGVTFAPTTTATVTTTSVPSFTGTTSNLSPAVNEAVTVTVTGATLDPATTLVLGATPPTITDLTTNSITFIPNPGTTAQLVIEGVVLDELPQIPLPLTAPLTDTIKVSAEIPTIPGTDASATAPSLVTPGLDRSSVLFDKPDFVADVNHYYELNVAQEGVYTVTLNWDIGGDIDMFLCDAAGVGSFDCDFQAATGAHPEIGEYALTPGTYYVVANDYGGDAAGTTLQINVDHAAPAPPAVRAAQARTAAAVRKVAK